MSVQVQQFTASHIAQPNRAFAGAMNGDSGRHLTSGQHEPDFSLLHPYSSFPKQVEGPTLWDAADYKDSPAKWQRRFTAEEVEQLSEAADTFMGSGLALTAMTKSAFPLPSLEAEFAQLRDTIVNGRGFVLFKGLPVNEWGLEKSATVYMGLGTYFGNFVSQNRFGHTLGHVKDLGEDGTKTDKVRIYRTNNRQFFHTDAGDLVGLLCMARSFEGGESDIVSTHAVYNALAKEHPDALETLTRPIWYFDRKGEVSNGQNPWYRSAVFYMENEPDASRRRVFAKFDPFNVTSLARFNSGPDAKIPPLSEEQLYAMKCLEDTALRLSLHMILEPGDIQLITNTHVFHARTAYKDWAPGTVDENGKPRQRRHLMRLWLAVPETEGGWKTPFHDSKQRQRGGIQVNDQEATCPTDAE